MLDCTASQGMRREEPGLSILPGNLTDRVLNLYNLEVNFTLDTKEQVIYGSNWFA
jgi:hypothetical protein